MKEKKKQLCKTEYWMLRCKCKRCLEMRESSLRIYMNKIWWDAIFKSDKGESSVKND